ncbi:MAG: Extended-spectrum beta-lactamase PER-1 precursor [Firmicutes bacterium ADurb.Bin419]|nr:MAG: Extended-spectrum beta-lactamase PER-1 precursor [Firmicutes bacterium ADurb.Bin419]
MKKVIAIIIVLLVNACFVTDLSSEKSVSSDIKTPEYNSVLFMINNPYASVNGHFDLLDSKNTQVEPVLINDRTLVPIRFFSEKFGYEVGWDSDSRISTIVNDDKTICIKPDSSVITVNGTEILLDVPSRIIRDRLYVPLRSINEMVGKKVSYKKGIILITDEETSIEDYEDKEFTDIYFNFVKMDILNEHNTEALPRWKAAYELVNHIMAYYGNKIPSAQVYFFPDYKTIPKESYYHTQLAVYLNLLKVEKGDFEPFKPLVEEEVKVALSKFEEMLIKEPELNLVNNTNTQKDLLSIINNIVKNKSDIIRISVYDFETDKSVNYNDQEHFYAASLTKVVNLLCFLEEVKNGKFDLNSTYTLKKSDKYVGGAKVTGTGNLQYQANGTKYTYRDILSRMISLSDNVGANIIFDALGSNKIDSFCQKYELKDTKIYKKFYDANSAVPSNYTTAADLTRMLVLLENRVVADDSLATMGIEFMKNTDNKDRIPRNAPKDVVIANKIGSLSRLAGDMALIYFPDRDPIALTIVVEGKNRKQINEAEANELIGQLSKEIINYYRQFPNPSLYIDGNLVQKSIGFRFINNRPYTKWNDSLEIYSPESIFIGAEKYITLDSLCGDNKCGFLLEGYPCQSIRITGKN